jgi:hypothetical protein
MEVKVSPAISLAEIVAVALDDEKAKMFKPNKSSDSTYE